MWEHPAMRTALKTIPTAERVSVSMSTWGAPTQKPTILIGTWPGLTDLHMFDKHHKRVSTETLMETRPDGRVDGKKKSMSTSAAYPPSFGRRGHCSLSVLPTSCHNIDATQPS